jgi:hypothetical protein
MAPNPKYANMSAYIWAKTKDWLVSGGALDKHNAWDNDFKREFGHNGKDQLVMETKKQMKARGLASPDHADALAMTFAYPVQPTRGPGSANTQLTGSSQFKYNPLTRKVKK